MSRKNTGAWKAIHSMCEMQDINEEALYQKAKMLLSIYRRVCWSTVGRAEAVSEDICCYCGSDVDGALIYLETFAPDEQKARFEARIQSLFESRWKNKCTESEMLEMLNLERSRYYDKKKEAIMVFGLALWGAELPKVKEFLQEEPDESLVVMSTT